MGKAKTIRLTVKEARLALEGVSELPWSDEGAALCGKLEKFLEASA